MSNKLLFDTIDSLYHVNVKGKENIDRNEARIYISNQVSLIDFRLILNQLPDNTYVIGSKYFLESFPVLQIFQDNVLVVEMGSSKSIKKILNMLKEGNSILIYPEGELTKTGTLMKLNDGVSFFARKSNRKIQPLVIEGTERTPLSSYGTEGFTDKKNFPNVQITIGEPFELVDHENVSKEDQKRKDRDLIYEKLNELMFNSKIRDKRNLWNDLIETSVTYGSDKKVVLSGHEELSYKELFREISNYEQLLEGCENEESIGVILPNSSWYVLTLFALFKQGKTPVLFPIEYKENFDKYIELTDLKTLVTSQKLIRFLKLEEWVKEKEGQLKIVYIENVGRRRNVFSGKGKKIVEEKDQKVIFLSHNEDKEVEGKVFNHEQLFAGFIQNSLTVGIRNHDKLLSLIPYSNVLGFTFGLLFPLLRGTPFVAEYYPKASEHNKIIYTVSPTILLSTYEQLKNIYEKGDYEDFNFTEYVFCSLDQNHNDLEGFQLNWFKKYRKMIYTGYYNERTSNFLSLNTSIQYKYNSLGRLMTGNKITQSNEINTPTKCIGKITKEGYSTETELISLEEQNIKVCDNYLE